MALFVFGTDSIGSGIRANLGSTSGSVYVAKGVNVASTDNYRTIYGTGSQHTVENHGNIFAIGICIDLVDYGSPTQFGNRVINGEGALVRAYGGIDAVAARVYGYKGRVDNDGQIVSDNYALIIGGSNASTQSVVNNAGRIVGDNYGITRFGATTEKLVINNTGLIQGGLASFDSSAEVAPDIIYNKGRMAGDVLLGGGDDTYDGRTGRVDGKVLGGAGKDTLLGGSGAETLDGGAGNDTIKGGGGNDKLLGGADDDTISGGDGNDRIEGGTGKDTLSGEAGKDTILGGDGDDTLTGGAGADRLTGGAGKDMFVFKSTADSTVAASGRDTITDFSRAQGDKIDLHAIDASTKAKGNQDFDFIGTQKFHKVAGELRYEKKGGDTFVHGDVNGDGKADFSILIDASLTLKAGDFIL